MEKDRHCIDGRRGRVLYLRDYANYIKDTLIQELRNLSCTMILTIDINLAPTYEARHGQAVWSERNVDRQG